MDKLEYIKKYWTENAGRLRTEADEARKRLDATKEKMLINFNEVENLLNEMRQIMEYIIFPDALWIVGNGVTCRKIFNETLALYIERKQEIQSLARAYKLMWVAEHRLNRVEKRWIDKPINETAGVTCTQG